MHSRALSARTISTSRTCRKTGSPPNRRACNHVQGAGGRDAAAQGSHLCVGGCRLRAGACFGRGWRRGRRLRAAFRCCPCCCTSATASAGGLSVQCQHHLLRKRMPRPMRRWRTLGNLLVCKGVSTNVHTFAVRAAASGCASGCVCAAGLASPPPLLAPATCRPSYALQSAIR